MRITMGWENGGNKRSSSTTLRLKKCKIVRGLDKKKHRTTVSMNRIQNGWNAFGKNTITLKSNMTLCLKRKVLNQCILPALTYKAKTWTLTKEMVQRLQIT